jgi:hypothetical protein
MLTHTDSQDNRHATGASTLKSKYYCIILFTPCTIVAYYDLTGTRLNLHLLLCVQIIYKIKNQINVLDFLLIFYVIENAGEELDFHAQLAHKEENHMST